MKILHSLGAQALVEIDMEGLFPGLSSDLFQPYIQKNEVVRSAAAAGYGPVTETDIREYARSTHNDTSHWTAGVGRRFLMDPILQRDGKGLINFCGPYADIGSVGYELGLWCDPVDPVKPPNFPTIARHPSQMGYSRRASLVMKTL